MKILHIVPTYLPAFRYGGPIKSVHELNKWLVKKGAEVTVYTTNLGTSDVLTCDDHRKSSYRSIDGVKICYFPVSFRPWQYSYSLHRALAKNIKNFDLVHITSVFLAASTLGAYYAKKFNKPYIISPRGSLMIEPLKKKSPLKKRIYLSLIEKRNLRNAAAVHFTTEAEKEEYLKAGLPFKKAIIIPNGLDPAEFQSYETKSHKIDFRGRFGISADKKIVLFLSRLNWKKGLDTLIPAFAKIRGMAQKDIVLVIAGPDEENCKEEVIKTINSYNLSFFDFSQRQSAKSALISPNQHKSASIIFTGMLLGDNKIAALRESDVFVLPSYSENFGMAVVEAMAAGLPVVITKGVAISNEVEKAGAGLVVEKDEKQVAEAILKILENPAMAKKMGENGRKLVKKEFSSEKVAEKWIEEYNKIYKNE